MQPGAGWAGHAPSHRSHTGLAVAVTIVVALLVGSALVTAGVLSGVIRVPQDQSVQPTPAAATVAPAPTPTPSPTPAPESVPSATAPDDFAGTYAEVASGVGLVHVVGCGFVGTGSGFLVADDKLATAAHVVDQATQISVSLDGTTVAASVLGVDQSTDLALLQLSEPVVGHVFDFASTDPSPGTQIAALGFPLDQPKTLTEGTVSGLDRAITTESGWFGHMMQTDTALNPGNSGGPLVTVDGAVVGVADALKTDAQGIAYAVPASVAAPAFTQQAGLEAPESPWCEANVGVDAGVQRTLDSYLHAINGLDYYTAMRQLTPSFRAESFGGPKEWADGYQSTYDDRLEIVSISGPDSNPTVWVEFRSTQAPGYGPEGARNAPCLTWSVDYAMVQVGSRWLIDGATGHFDSPYSRC